MPPTRPLTPREVEIIRAVATGQRTRELARTLHVEVDTLQGALRIIYIKLGIKSRGQLVRWAFHHGYGDAPIPEAS